MAVSEVASIKEAIELSYLSAKLGLSGLAYGTSRHLFMTAKQERIGDLHVQLQALVGKEQAIQVVAETMAHLPEIPTQSTILTVLRSELGDTEETTWLLERIEDVWETREILITRFGDEVARKIIETPSACMTEKIQRIVSPGETDASF